MLLVAFYPWLVQIIFKSIVCIMHNIYHVSANRDILVMAIKFIFCCRVCQLFVSNTCSFLAAILFTVHPIHTEAVSNAPLPL